MSKKEFLIKQIEGITDRETLLKIQAIINKNLNNSKSVSENETIRKGEK